MFYFNNKNIVLTSYQQNNVTNIFNQYPANQNNVLICIHTQFRTFNIIRLREQNFYRKLRRNLYFI